jgi:hypothetical protein
MSLYTYTYYLAALVVCGLSLWKGDRPLQRVAGVTIISWSITPLLSYWDDQHLNVFQTITDAITAAFYVWISLKHRRLWIVILAALSILIVACPLVYLLDARVHRNSWVAANNMLAISQLIVILVVFLLGLRARGRADEGVVRP